jgi:hypothetical protein
MYQVVLVDPEVTAVTDPSAIVAVPLSVVGADGRGGPAIDAGSSTMANDPVTDADVDALVQMMAEAASQFARG